jgi:ribonucleoside-diphosphate reductase alpha chain
MKAAADKAEYDLIDPRNQTHVGKLNATEVYRTLVKQAWKNGDPGIIFLDRINRDNPTPALGEIESTNPCGEQPLLPLEACNLGSVNLAKFVIENGDGPMIDFEGLKEIVTLSVRFLDNTIDVSKYPLPEITAMVRGNRKIGLGVMGFADMLYQLNIPYDSDEALETADAVMHYIQETAHEASRNLAEEKGVFENYDQSIYKDQGIKYRNATTTTIAPTGTLSILAGCSSGIEPLFALSFVRNVMDNDKLLEVNPYFEKVAIERDFYSRELMDTIAKTGSIRELMEIPEDVRHVFATAHDVSPDWHVRMQAAFQKHTDNAVSKTVNLPHDATEDDVAKVYDLAFELGCKGVTIYRDGSKENQVLSFTQKTSKEDGFMTAVKERPETLEGYTTKIKTGYGALYVTVTEFDGQPFEVFATIGKSGRSTTAKTEAIGRLVSLALRSGVKVDKIVDQLKGIGGEYPIFQDGGLVLSIPDAISRVLERGYVTGKNAKKNHKSQYSLMGEKCPECGQTVSFEEGCMICHFCGFNKCG